LEEWIITAVLKILRVRIWYVPISTILDPKIREAIYAGALEKNKYNKRINGYIRIYFEILVITAHLIKQMNTLYFLPLIILTIRNRTGKNIEFVTQFQTWSRWKVRINACLHQCGRILDKDGDHGCGGGPDGEDWARQTNKVVFRQWIRNSLQYSKCLDDIARNQLCNWVGRFWMGMGDLICAVGMRWRLMDLLEWRDWQLFRRSACFLVMIYSA